MGQPQVALTTAQAGAPDILDIVLDGRAATSDQGQARLAFWRAATGGQAAPSAALEARLARDVMALMGRVPADRVLARRGPMLDRAAAALRAADHPPRAACAATPGPPMWPWPPPASPSQASSRWKRWT